jgi:hypothetical protein
MTSVGWMNKTAAACASAGTSDMNASNNRIGLLIRKVDPGSESDTEGLI